MADKFELIPVSVLENNVRLKEIVDEFLVKYGESPKFVVRVPGRVNLIGEHIDYCGYSVFPMAIDQNVLVATLPVSDASSRVLLANTNQKYGDHQFSLTSISINRNPPEWHDYFKCGVKGILERAEAASLSKESYGVKALVSGSIPPCAGLSSSSALVCAAALATASALNVTLSKKDMADLCARSERYIGTEGGGMDQAIALLANAGHAKLIEFEPLRATDVLLPDGCRFVIAHSLAEANKAATFQFNCRVVECRLAAKVLAKKKSFNPELVRRLVDVQTLLQKSLPEMADLVREVLHQEPYTKQEIAEILEISTEELEQKILTENTRHVVAFKLYQRALHVFEEANRVLQFKSICDQSDESSLSRLGRLMFDSHSSCRDLYECSHPQLDSLVQLSQNVALGARLTGAGWGGCIVAMVTEDRVDEYLNYLKTEYYAKLPAAQGRDLSEIIFPTQPGAGAAVHLLEPSTN